MDENSKTPDDVRSHEVEELATPEVTVGDQPIEPESEPVSPEQTSDDGGVTTDQKPARKKPILFIVIIAVLVVLGGAFFVWKDQVLGLFIKQPDGPVSQGTDGVSGDDQGAAGLVMPRFIAPTTGEIWYATPKEVENLGLLNNDYRDTFATSYSTQTEVDDMYARMKPTYYEVGTHGDKTIIMARQHVEMGYEYAVFFERTAGGAFSLIEKPSSTATYDQYDSPSRELRAGKATVDSKTYFDSLSMPDSIKLKDGDTVTSMKYPWFSFGKRTEGTSETVVMKLGAATLYRTEKAYADTKLTNIGYVIRYSFGPELSVDYVPNARSLEKYTFDNGKTAAYKDSQGATAYDEIAAIARGCGGTSAAVTRSDSLSDGDLVAIGKTDTGRTVYGLKDKTATLMTKAYEEYKLSWENPVSLDDYIANHGLLIIKNTSGERLVYVRGMYSMGGGCAKPVVYLYPTHTTTVSVKVGADVKISDPLYPANGWRNVVARPNGQLSYDGKTYDSLFWEGTGYGEYPGITSGAVVKRSEAKATIKRQLAEQGLNAKETADFMEFWGDKIPNKPYIRLTWLTTAQMNTLAPLSISPKPDTLFRVFLDMDGFDMPIQLPAQKLTKVERKGFTVIEWGGLTAPIK